MAGALHNENFSWMWANHKIKSTMEFFTYTVATHNWPCEKGKLYLDELC